MSASLCVSVSFFVLFLVFFPLLPNYPLPTIHPSLCSSLYLRSLDLSISLSLSLSLSVCMSVCLSAYPSTQLPEVCHYNGIYHRNTNRKKANQSSNTRKKERKKKKRPTGKPKETDPLTCGVKPWRLWRDLVRGDWSTANLRSSQVYIRVDEETAGTVMSLRREMCCLVQVSGWRWLWEHL